MTEEQMAQIRECQTDMGAARAKGKALGEQLDRLRAEHEAFLEELGPGPFVDDLPTAFLMLKMGQQAQVITDKRLEIANANIEFLMAQVRHLTIAQTVVIQQVAPGDDADWWKDGTMFDQADDTDD